MKQYKKLYSFGCSHTEGGGLNNQNWHRYLNGDTFISKEPEPILPEHIEYATKHSYPGYLSRMLNCDFYNYGTSRASNEYIFKLAYEKIAEITDPIHSLVTIQTSHLNRILLNISDLKLEYNVNSVEIHALDDRDVAKIIKSYYELFITNFFDEIYEFKKLIRTIDTFSSYCKEKQLDVVYLIWDKPNSFDKPIKLEIDLGVRDAETFGRKNKLKISDIPDCKYNDPHFSPTGNELLAKYIYNHLQKFNMNGEKNYE